ncbi:molybdopterin molybdotransferase MoeA [Aeromicrobium sp. YIM 150415]|uniref:molybdopterin molybdotransferase MoeA n=1 Tax=Aeromicrobium sp. YIM 150415 TaxID=2803912 RepID=UPI0019661B06|nr:gephyrin-like molybdotransferase Glp [Aeromicrobium sp. YIM 150415]MBM9462770.1 molybdopterin molybdotransferase MoeA [Aeromicrobium sp. YIM 150415]
MTVSLETHRTEVERLLTLADQRRRARPADSCPLPQSLGRRLARDVAAPEDVPAFDNSQMDGFAVRSTDLRSATTAPVTLPVAAPIAAGASAVSLTPGTAAPIMTGAPIPAGADAVIPIERTRPGDFSAPEVTFDAAAPGGQYVRPRGDDIRAGAVLMPAGTSISVAGIGALTGAGLMSVEVEPTLRIAIISTGDEIANGQIPDSNSAALAAACAEIGAHVDRFICSDSPDEFDELLDRLDHDLALTIGGVSAGAYEVVRQALSPLAEAWFDHVPLQPGGPQGRAVRAGLPILCLPGNPVSSLVSFELFIRPGLARRCGQVDPDRPCGTAPLAAPLTSIPGKLQVRRGTLDEHGEARVIGGAGSHLLAAYAVATHLIFVPAEIEELAAGDTVSWWRIAAL